MQAQAAALYIFVSLVCALVSISVQKQRFPGDFLAYFIVGLAGGWIGAVLFSPFGILFSGLSISGAAFCAALLMELDYKINCKLSEAEKSQTLQAQHSANNFTNSGAKAGRACRRG
jgi:uncharacterized membrane protein YeaQ/YmgE (transglycosylase-associated protein family)